MTKLKIAAVPDDKPVKVTAELPASVHRDLAAYAEAIARETGQRADPTKLIAPMLAQARKATMVSGIFGNRPATRSPASIPCSFKKAANAAT